MTKKTSKYTIKKKSPSKEQFFDFFDMGTWKIIPISDAYLERLAQELVVWAMEDDEALKLEQFYVLKGIYQATFREWRLRNPILEKAADFALMVIGNRREIGALKRKLDAGLVATSMAHYDESWKKLAEWRASLHKSDQDKALTLTVLTEPIPNSPQVLPL